MKYLKDPKIIVIVFLIVVMLISAVFVQKNITETDTYHKTEIHTLDSLYKVDSVSMIQKYMILDSSYKVVVSERDSLAIKDSINSHTKKTTIQYIYKDSTIIITVEDTEYIAVTQRTITSLRDSIGESNKNVFELNTQIANLQKELKVKKTDTLLVDSSHSKIVTVPDKKFVVYGNVFSKASQDINVGVGAEVGGEYKILSPMYIGASIRKDGIESTSGYNAIIKAGAKFEF